LRVSHNWPGNQKIEGLDPSNPSIVRLNGGDDET
jgi:hypothetical protein